MYFERTNPYVRFSTDKTEFSFQEQLSKMRSLIRFLGIVVFALFTFSPINTATSICLDDTCIDERSGCEGTVYTFSCGSDICQNQSDPQCYICVC